MRVLIIDDDPDALKVAKARLARENLEIQTAMGAAEGIELAFSCQPDLILLDIDMPEMSGFDVLKSIKAHPEACMIPVIFLSGTNDNQDKVKGLDMGAIDYVTKPFDAYELRARVRAALRMKHFQDLLIRYASIDPLTELANRRTLLSRLQEEWSRIQRHGGSVSFVFGDIDNFKNINDKYGHRIGDEALKNVSMVIAQQCRLVDMPARYGGEEFAVVLPDETLDGGLAMAERCRRNIEKLRIVTDSGEFSVTASFGVSDSGSASTIDEMIQQADERLYNAKESGKNRVFPSEADNISGNRGKKIDSEGKSKKNI